MDGKELLKALLAQAQLNPNSLANALQNRSLQSQVTRFIEGKTVSPRWSTLEPVAAFFQVRVEAFFDSSIATQVAKERGLVPGDGPSSEISSGIQPARPPTAIRVTISLHDQLLQLARELQPYDLSARKAVASLLGDLALSPETAEITAARISRLLDAPGNALPQKSTPSAGGALNRGQG